MPPRVAYWTSVFEPDMEAISSEVALLRRRFPSSVAWGLSRRHWAILSWRRGYCLNPRLHLLFRGLTRLLEPVFQLNHVFGSLGDWFYLEGVKRRPTVLTLAAQGLPVKRSLLDRVDCFVAESPAGSDRLRQIGIDAQRIRLIFPPVDLARFRPAAAPSGPFTVLFASSPADADSLEARGVPLILDAAALEPTMRFRLLWRPWGNSLQRVEQWIAQRGLSNVELVAGKCADMPGQYRSAHATIAPFTCLDRAKPVPNSVVESLACGRPVVTTDSVELASLIDEEQAGLTAQPSGAALAASLARLRTDWNLFSPRARRMAERWFGEEKFLQGYDRIYQELL